MQVGRKLKFVLSDLHLGAGYQESNYLEDFTVDKKLACFLQQIWHESERDQREVELIINGDFLEFLQVPAVDNYQSDGIYPSEAYLDSSEQASLKRLNLIILGHPLVFDALSDFIHVEAPQRRITVIKGNHDVNLYWPGVKSRLREQLGASGTRSSLLLFAEEFISREKIYVEHGHQRTKRLNYYPDFLDPRLPGNPTQLYYPFGSRFVVDFFNNLGREYWFVDNIKPVTTLIWYALRWDFAFAVNMLVHFARHTPALAMNGATAQVELDLLPDNWLPNLEDGDIQRNWATRYTVEPAFRREFHQRVHQCLNNPNPAGQEPSIDFLTGAGDDPLALGQVDQQQQRDILRRAATEIARRQGAEVVLFGHTHDPVREILETGDVYINTGGWLRDLSTASPETWQALFTGTLSYHDFPLHLPYARIDYDKDNQPIAQLLDFAAEADCSVPAESPRSESSPDSFIGRTFNELARRFFNRT